jgi:NPCBM/NEW2 domain
MKKITIFSMAMLCLIKIGIAQTEIITFPTEGSVFQANSSGTFQITFGGQVKNSNAMFYRIEKRNGNNNWQEIVNDVSIITNFSALTGGIGRGIFSTTNSTNLSKGWYRLSLYRKWYNWFGTNTVRSIKHQVQFGVGDVYFIAGQSNASGYGGSNYNIQGTAGGLDNTVSSILNNTNLSPMARILQSKISEQMVGLGGLNLPQKFIELGIPYKTGFSEFKNGIVANPANPSERVPVYPNGYNSWCWAPLAHKIANPSGSHKYSGTPTMWFNVASPSTVLQDNGLADLNIWNINPTINAASRLDFLGRAFNQTLMGKFKQTLETFAGPFGAKGVLWHQGEADHDAIMNKNTYVTVTGYQTSLTNIINESRQFATGSPSNSSLNWFVAQASLFPRGATIPNSTISSGLSISSLQNNSNYLGASTDKLYTSQLLRNNQSVSLSNVFAGPNTDLINSADPNIQRSNKYFIHLSGSSLQKAADDWYATLNQTSNSLSPTIPIKITQVVKNSSTSYTVTVDNTIGSNEFVWLVDGYGLNNWYAQSTSNSSTFNGVQPNYFLHGYAKKNGRWHAIMPFMVPGGTIETKKLTLSDNNLPAPTQGGIISTKVTAIDTEWELQTINSTYSWLTASYDQDESIINVNVVANNSSSSRTGVIQLMETGGGLGPSLTITQSGNTSGLTNLISLTPSASTGWYNVNNSVNGNGMLISGNPYSNGFGIHSNHLLTFNLNGQYSNFSGKVGRDDEEDPNTGGNNVGQMVFKIKANGAVVWTSIIHNSSTNAECFNVSLAGVSTLELVTEMYENNYYDHGDWVDLVLNSPSYPVSCTTCKNNEATNFAANPTNLPSSGGSSTLSATCPVNTNFLWQTGANTSSIMISTTVSTSYWVKCVGNNCSDSDPKYINVNVTPTSGCSGISDGVIAGYWNPNGTNFPLVVRNFNNSYWLTQRIGSNPDKFLVRGHNMLFNSDITSVNSSVSSQPGCFSWQNSTFGGLMPPSSPSEFQTPTGYALNWECTSGTPICNSSNGTPIYVAGGSPPPPPPPTGCSGTFYLNNSWTYAGGVTSSPTIGGNTVGGNMIMGGINYSAQNPGKGLGMHANSEVVYDLGANHGYTTFKALCGKDDGNFCSASWAGQEKINFKIINNTTGVLINQVIVGNPTTGIIQTAELIATITGVRYIKLVAADGGDGNFCDWANWANARVLCTSSGRQGVEENAEIEESVLILPNPNKGNFDVSVNLNSSSDLNLVLIDAIGHIFKTQNYPGQKGSNLIPFKINNMAQGKYILKVQTKEKLLTTAVIIE